SGDFARAAREVYHDLAFEIEAGEVVELVFGNGECVAAEDGGGVGVLGEVATGGECRVVAELERSDPALLSNCEAGLLFDDLRDFEFDWLEVTSGSGGLESGALEFAREIFSSAAVAWGSGVAAFEFVVGEDLDVGPPAVAFFVQVGCGEGGGG